MPRLDRRGLVRCPWGCGRTVRRTKNNNAKIVYVEPEPNNLGRIAAYCDDHDVWHSRQLRTSEAPTAYERLYLIHTGRCPSRLARQHKPPPRPPRPRIVPPPPGPIPPALAEKLAAELEEIRRRRRGGGL